MRKEFFKYCLITYFVSWSFWTILWVLVHYSKTSYGEPVFMFLFLAGGIFPAFAAFIVGRKDKETRIRLKAEILRAKVGFLWYIAIFLAPLFISGISWVLFSQLHKNIGPFLQRPIYLIFGMLPIMVLGGGSEEIGWRGIMLSKLLTKLSPLRATLIVSFVWGIWHLPLWFIVGVPQYGSNFLYFIAGTFSLSLLLTIIYIATRSLFICILFHAIENAYLNIGMDSWASNYPAGFMNVVVSFLISAILFWMYFKIKPNK